MEKNIRLLTEDLDGDANNVIWANDSRSLYFAYDERGVRKIGQVSVKGKRNEVI